MKPNITSVTPYLPINISFNKSDLSECAYILYHRKNNTKLDRETDSKKVARIFIEKVLVARVKKIEDEKILRKKITVLYHLCIRYKVDCYSACCRFIEYKFSPFIECPDRAPNNKNYTEQQGGWWNKIILKTGYYKYSCGDLCKQMNIKNHQEYIVDNLLSEFKEFINVNHKVLAKHFKQTYTDYSHMAYNGSVDDF